MRISLVLLLMFSLSACLKTRSELRGGSSANLPADGQRYPAGNMNEQQMAKNQSRFFEIDNDFRQLYGKVEVLERQISDLKDKSTTGPAQAPAAGNDTIKALEKRISTLEEALLSIDKKLSEIKSDKTSAAPVVKPKGPFGYGELYYSQGKFEEAIASYDKYRKQFPRGKRYAQATLKMGLAFQKLEMNQDAKAFYKEVIQRYPKTRVAILAEKNLKKL